MKRHKLDNDVIKQRVADRVLKELKYKTKMLKKANIMFDLNSDSSWLASLYDIQVENFASLCEETYTSKGYYERLRKEGKEWTIDYLLDNYSNEQITSVRLIYKYKYKCVESNYEMLTYNDTKALIRSTFVKEKQYLELHHDYHLNRICAYAVSNLTKGYSISCIKLDGVLKGTKHTFLFDNYMHYFGKKSAFFTSIDGWGLRFCVDDMASYIFIHCGYEWDIREWFHMKRDGLMLISCWFNKTNVLGSFSKDFVNMMEAML